MSLLSWLSGEIWLPIWAPITTTEARLLVAGSEVVEYDNLKYEEQMFHFNTVTRVGRYDHKVKAEGVDFCYDCRAEVCRRRCNSYAPARGLFTCSLQVEVLTAYLSKFKATLTEDERNAEAGRMSEE